MGGSGACRLEGNERAGSVGTEGSTEDKADADADNRAGYGNVRTGTSTGSLGRPGVGNGYSSVISGRNDGALDFLGTWVGSGVYTEVENGDTGGVWKILENNKEYPVSSGNTPH